MAHDHAAAVGAALLSLIEAGVQPHIRVRERDVTVAVWVTSGPGVVDGARRRRVGTSGATVGQALERAVGLLGVPR